MSVKPPVRANEPFQFYSRLSLTYATGLRAGDLPELLEGIKAAADSTIYAHTHRFIQQHQFLVPEPTNDFAVWAAEALGDEAAGERLMAVDPLEFNTIAALRAALASTVEAHLRRRPELRRAPEGDEFYFVRSVRFSIPTPYLAHDLAELRETLRKISPASLYLHVFEARLRPPLGMNDFSIWLEKELDEGRLAKEISALDPYSHTHEALRNRIITLIERRLEEVGHG